MDIVSLFENWINKVKGQVDVNYDVVCHHFQRSSTNAMITWFVTKVGFVMLNIIVPSIEQPLCGKLLLIRRAIEDLLVASHVGSQSDWGINILKTFVIAHTSICMAKVYILEGKVHVLYDGLCNFQTMLVECFFVIQSLKNEVVGSNISDCCIEFAKVIAKFMHSKVGYDIEKSLKFFKSH
jgi:mannosylglycerate synthase